MGGKEGKEERDGRKGGGGGGRGKEGEGEQLSIENDLVVQIVKQWGGQVVVERDGSKMDSTAAELVSSLAV